MIFYIGAEKRKHKVIQQHCWMPDIMGFKNICMVEVVYETWLIFELGPNSPNKDNQKNKNDKNRKSKKKNNEKNAYSTSRPVPPYGLTSFYLLLRTKPLSDHSVKSLAF